MTTTNQISIRDHVKVGDRILHDGTIIGQVVGYKDNAAVVHWTGARRDSWEQPDECAIFGYGELLFVDHGLRGRFSSWVIV